MRRGPRSTKHLCRIELLTAEPATCIGTASTEAHIGLRLLGYKRFVRARVWQQERHRFLPPRLVKEISRLLIPGIRRLSARGSHPARHGSRRLAGCVETPRSSLRRMHLLTSVHGMSEKKVFTAEQARAAGEQIGIDWASSRFDVEQLRMGMDVELEHGKQDLATNVTDDDVVVTAKIARAHLNEFPDYYDRLAVMEAEAEAFWATRSE